MVKDKFFEAMAGLGLALSYDDVRLKTGQSEVQPADVKLATRFSRSVPLNCPLASAAMDTVTESRMAIAMAKAGGIGVIHRKLGPKEQATEVKRVKFYLIGGGDKPICVRVDETVQAVIDRKAKKGYQFSTFPVLDANGKLVGMLGRNDIEMCLDTSITVDRMMTRNVVSSRPDTSLDAALSLMVDTKRKVLPLVNEAGEVVGLRTFSDIRRVKAGDARLFNLDGDGHLRVAAAIGTGAESLERAELLISAGVDVVVIDTAHGDSKPVYEILRELKRQYPKTDIVVGNVSEGESAKRLADAGADGVKVGQGPGSICTTRIVAGVGCPQVTAVYNCAKAVEAFGIPICADGGIKHSGDIPIAIGAGASCVMLGKLLAGAEEAPGDLFVCKGVRYKVYRGMGSLSSMLESRESRQRYQQQQEIGRDKLVPEGVDAGVPCDGPVERLLFQYLGGLRAGMGYVGAATIEQLRERADFYRISSAGLAESHPHDVVITADAPNYHAVVEERRQQ